MYLLLHCLLSIFGRFFEEKAKLGLLPFEDGRPEVVLLAFSCLFEEKARKAAKGTSSESKKCTAFSQLKIDTRSCAFVHLKMQRLC